MYALKGMHNILQELLIVHGRKPPAREKVI